MYQPKTHGFPFKGLRLLRPQLAHPRCAYFGALIAASHKLGVAFSIGALFLIAGSYMVYLISSSPLWFSALDLCVAYLPMSWLGWRLATASKRA